MARVVLVKALSDTSVKVNNKVVYQDVESQWVACSELSVKEIHAFQNYKEAVIDNIGRAEGSAEYKF